MEGQKSEIRVRRSIQKLQEDYENNKNNELVLLLKALATLQKEPLRELQKRLLEEMEGLPSNVDFFGRMAGIHGLSFVKNSSQYCEHRTVLFPTWHRAYLFTLEEGLRSVPGCENVTLPYWDPFYKEPTSTPVPWVFTQPEIDLRDGNPPIKNPLYSYTFPHAIDAQDLVEAKPKGYETVRYPLSGLAGTEAARQFSREQNREYDSVKQVEELNLNINRWLDGPSTELRYGIRDKYADCLKEESYYYFSHRTEKAPLRFVVPLESPHDQMHMAVGGFAPDFEVENNEAKERVSKRKELMLQDPAYQTKKYSFGDMQFVPLAAFDPIFWFHHCYVDFIFSQWQKAHNQIKFEDLVIRAEGPNKEADEKKAREDLQRPLKPFLKKDGTVYKSADCTNTKDLGYDYEESASLQSFTSLQHELAKPNKVRLIVVQNINRAGIKGPFVVQVRHRETEQIVWEEAVFNRMNIENCPTCQENLVFGFSFPYSLRDCEVHFDDNQLRKEFEVSFGGQAKHLNRGNPHLKAHFTLEAVPEEKESFEKHVEEVVVTLGDYINL